MRRRFRVAIVVAVLASCAAGPPSRSAWKKELARQIIAAGVASEAEARCISQRFIDAMTDAQLADFNHRGHLNAAEKADVATLTIECQQSVTS